MTGRRMDDRPAMWLEVMRDHDRCVGECATCGLLGDLAPERLAELGAEVRSDMPKPGKPGVPRPSRRTQPEPVPAPTPLLAWERVREAATGDPALTVGVRIAAIRQARGWSQADLADRIGVQQNAVSIWEQGKNDPAAQCLYRLAQVFGCSMDGLYAGGARWEPLPSSAHVEAPARACPGTSSRGPCKRWTREPSGYCSWHSAQAGRPLEATG